MKTRVCVTIDTEVKTGIESRGLKLSTVVNTMLQAFLNPSIEFRVIPNPISYQEILDTWLSYPHSGEEYQSYVLSTQDLFKLMQMAMEAV